MSVKDGKKDKRRSVYPMSKTEYRAFRATWNRSPQCASR